MSLFDLPRKVLKLAHINICSLRNKIEEISELLSIDIQLLAISETHLDDTFKDKVLLIQGCNIFRRDRNAYGGGVAVYVQNQIPVKVRYDLMAAGIEVLWLQINLPHIKYGYRLASANLDYLDQVGAMLDKSM